MKKANEMREWCKENGPPHEETLQPDEPTLFWQPTHKQDWRASEAALVVATDIYTEHATRPLREHLLAPPTVPRLSSSEPCIYRSLGP